MFEDSLRKSVQARETALVSKARLIVRRQLTLVHQLDPGQCYAAPCGTVALWKDPWGLVDCSPSRAVALGTLCEQGKYFSGMDEAAQAILGQVKRVSSTVADPGVKIHGKSVAASQGLQRSGLDRKIQ